MRNGILALTLVGLLSSCTSVVNTVVKEPINPDLTSTPIGSDINDLKMDTFIGVNIKKADPALKKAHVNVHVYNSIVLLTGEVGSAADKERAERLAKSQENVSAVVNDLAIEPASSLTQRSKDAITTGQIKALLVDAKDLQSNAFKVVTERGVIYLLGRVTSREAQRASEIARSSSVSGVVKVVRVFEIITEEELKRISAQPLSPQAQPKL